MSRFHYDITQEGRARVFNRLDTRYQSPTSLNFDKVI